MNTFAFNRREIILIYGYGKIGKEVYAKLTEQGYKVAGFIDKNAIKYNNVIVDYCLITPDELNAELKEHIIILTFQNILEQERIAKILFEKGFYKIIFLNRSNDDIYEKCFEAYNNLIYGKTVEDFEFPYIEIKFSNATNFYCCQTGESIIIELPDTLVFSTKYALEEKNIVAFNEYNAACELILKGETDDFENYKRYCNIACGEGRTIEKFIQDRVFLFDILHNEYRKKGIAFFRNSPSTAKWNPKGYFNLIDGHHRAVFLVSSLNYDIPIKISKDDFDQWCNPECTQACKEYIEKHHIKKTYTPIINPAFFDIDSISENRGRRTISALYKFFSREGLSKYHVLDLHSNLSYYAQAFSRMGALKIVSVEKRKLLFDLAELLNRLHYIKNIDMRNIDIFEIDERESFDIVILANDINLDFNTKKSGLLCLKKIDALSSKYFIWRSHTDPEVEKKYILENSKFSKYHFLNIVFIEGKLFEVGIYEK